MPEWIVRQSNHIEICPFVDIDILVKPCAIQRIVPAIIQMNHYLCCRANLFHCIDTCADKPRNICIVWRLTLWPEQSIRQFVSNLYHIWHDILFLQTIHYFFGKIIYCLLKLVCIKVRPCFWLALFARVCPEIAIVEIQKKAKPCRLYTFCHAKHCLIVCISSTIWLSIRRLRIIPKP